jgi:hypothetical protein
MPAGSGIRKTLGELRIVRHKVQPLARRDSGGMRRTALRVSNYPKSCARQVANQPHLAGRTTPSGPVRNNRKSFF